MKGIIVLIIIVVVACLLKLRFIRNGIRWLTSARYRHIRRELKFLTGQKAYYRNEITKIEDRIRGLK